MVLLAGTPWGPCKQLILKSSKALASDKDCSKNSSISFSVEMDILMSSLCPFPNISECTENALYSLLRADKYM